jgi:tight adherence protein B
MVVVFLAISGVIAALAFVLVGDKSGKAAERLDAMVGKGKRKESAAELLLKDDIRNKDKQNLIEAITPEILTLGKLFQQADCNIKPSSLFGIALVLAAVGATFSYMMLMMRQAASFGLYIAPIVGLVAFFIPYLWLLNKRRVRLKKFAEQLPDALELVARALRAGHALGAGMHVVAEEMPSPVCDEFGRVYDEQNLGIALEDAMRGMCDRVPNLDLRFFVTAVAIQRQTGGDLAEILDKIGYVVRERYKILGQVRALTAEGRLSGVVLVALPFCLLLLMMHMKPDYIEMLWTEELGRKMSVFALILMVLGVICIKKIVDIKV